MRFIIILHEKSNYGNLYIACMLFGQNSDVGYLPFKFLVLRYMQFIDNLEFYFSGIDLIFVPTADKCM